MTKKEPEKDTKATEVVPDASAAAVIEERKRAREHAETQEGVKVDPYDPNDPPVPTEKRD